MKTSRNDAGLLKAITEERDADALSALFQKYQKPAYNLALRLTLNREAAEEVFQEAMMVVWQSADTCRDANKLRSWILRIVALKSMQRTRSHYRERKHTNNLQKETLQSGSILPDEQSQSEELRGALGRALDELSSDEQRLLALRFGGGLRFAEIGKALTVPERTISYRIEGCLKKLKARLMEAGFAAGTLSPSLLCDTLCSGIEGQPLPEFSLDIDSLGPPSAPVKPLGATVLKWAALVVVVASGAVLAPRFMKDSARTEQDASPKVVSKPMPPPLDTQPTSEAVHKAWDFSDGPKPGFELITGNWNWKPALKKFPAGMHTLQGQGVTVKPLVRIPARPLKVICCVRGLVGRQTLDNVKNRSVIGALWALKGRIEVEQRNWRNRNFSFSARMKKPFKVQSYFMGRYMIALFEDQYVFSVIEHAQAYPDQEIYILARDFLVERIEIHTLEPEQIPERLRDPAQLVQALVAKGKLTLDPPRVLMKKNK